MKTIAMVAILLLSGTAGTAFASDLPIMPLRIELPPAMRKPLKSSCADCGVRSEAAIASERESRLATLLYNARHGGPEDWADLGRFYAYLAPPPNLKPALAWLKRAAQAGNLQAMNDLATLYHFGGKGLAPSPRLTEYWYSRAAEAGDHDAQVLLALLYTEGKFLPRDLVRAGSLYARAADSGDPGRLRVAAAFFEEYGDPNRAFDYRLRAWRAGIRDDNFLCAPDLRLSADRRGTALSLCDAHMDEHPRYERALADALIKGDAVPQNLPRAIAMLKSAVIDGNSEAAFVLAGLYERGDGVACDLGEAARLYAYAAGAGRPEAKTWLDTHPELEEPDDGFIDLPNLPEDTQGAIRAAIAQAKAPDDYPERAQDDEVEASTILDCQWSAAGKLEDCAVVEENPQGYGFAKASLRVAGKTVLPSATAKPGSHVLLRLMWRLQ